MNAVLLAALRQTAPIAQQPDGPGWTAVIPGLIFLVLAAIVWWLWRKLADADD